MQPPGKHKVSLRGASAKEITRDALLEKAAQERALRSQARKAASAALLIQRIWRGRHTACKAADDLRADWDMYLAVEQGLRHQEFPVNTISYNILRPFLFFVGHHRFCLHKDTRKNGDHERVVACFKILLQSINCSDPNYNFCNISILSMEQQGRWLYQVRRLIKLCCVALVEGSVRGKSEVAVTSLTGLAVRLMVALTDANLWKGLDQDERQGKARFVVLRLLEWMANGDAGLYPAVRSFILQSFPVPCDGIQQLQVSQKDKFVVTASAITVALRPLQGLAVDCAGGFSTIDQLGVGHCQNSAVRKAAEQLCAYILTIPFITRLPAAILPALQHPSVFTPCLKALATSVKGLFQGVTTTLPFATLSQQIDLDTQYAHIPIAAWTLANVVTLASGSFERSDVGNAFSGQFSKGLDRDVYVRAVCSTLEHLMPWIESLKQAKRKILESNGMDDYAPNDLSFTEFNKIGETFPNNIIGRDLVQQLQPVCQPWHLRQLMDGTPGRCRTENIHKETVNVNLGSQQPSFKFPRLPDVVKMYAHLLIAFSALNTPGGALPILNLLAFAQGLLVQVWEWLNEALLLRKAVYAQALLSSESSVKVLANKGGSFTKDESSGRSLSIKWASALSKMKGKSSGAESSDGDKAAIRQTTEAHDFLAEAWDIGSFRKGPGGLSEDTVPVMLLFCAAYEHLLMVLDDDEFYERQVPFTLENQRVIAASLNTMVYNGFFSASKHQFTSLMEMATRCLQSLYVRDCRRSFCHPNLWLAPAVKNHPPIAAAARAHEVATASLKMGDSSQAPAMGFVLTTIPHVLPFQQRVQIFREFVRADKMYRKMAGEVIGPGPGSIEIAIRRDHIVEDGFAQLNPLGAKLKSGINVSFVNEHGLPEAGLDYGGLFKEFLIDLAKAAFDPGYGLFAQTATEEGLLFPHPAAGKLGHGLQMIEFLGRIVGKALYEGLLLDYSFSHVFVWKLLGRYSYLDELSSLDPELHRSLMYLKRYEGDAQDLALDFTTTEEILGKRIVVELTAGGADIQVTNDNKLQYVHAMADYKLNQQMKPLINAFGRGLSDLIQRAWLSLFNAREFNQLLSGGEHDFDVDDLKTHTKYTGGFNENSRTVKLFWEVVRELESEERCALLKFVTSCSRAPLLGFKHLQPAFTIHKVACDTPVWAALGGQDVERLPSASTCYNTLKLPTYKRISTLRNKLRYAIRSNAGFELS